MKWDKLYSQENHKLQYRTLYSAPSVSWKLEVCLIIILLKCVFQSKGRTGFFKQAKKAYPMFPHTEERIKWDEYGEIIRYDNFDIHYGE